MHRKEATLVEREECIKFYKKLIKTMEGHDIDAILNTMCFTVGELGVDLNLTKQEFIAKIVEQVSGAYDLHKLANSEPEGEA